MGPKATPSIHACQATISLARYALRRRSPWTLHR